MKTKKLISLLCVFIMAITFMVTPVYAAAKTEKVDGRIIYYYTSCEDFFTNEREAYCYADSETGSIDKVTAELYDKKGAVRAWALAYGWSGATDVEISTGPVYTYGETGWYAKGTFVFQLPKCTRTLTDYASYSPSRRADIKTNADGKTYGSAYAAENEPDLISAVGINGQSGYCTRDDLRADHKSSTYIPVYDLDGAVIDTFYITVG